MKKHEISSDKKANSALQEELGELRGGIVDQANRQAMPARFKVKAHKDAPRMILTDTETDRTVEVPLFAYREVRKALHGLFG
ncbi:hypothetical protein IMZ31_23760 (plasmid) [Pontibacillus sp. ALD_SL1]|uniref:hypothetical protein n=1 Tax=Pontibacillus sp. ALD_SL1 TaxID=2777185 RepID=UPI001A959567|nr:hypothetical protein [Pontibacillus sp. ALD_SL1]QST02469.1 hypothetical protein IMZ31_23760 [Pontibacillus sp. ALD_SL1]